MHRAIGCVLAVLFAAPAAAQDARTWIFDDNPEMPVLMFGAPDSDNLLLTLSCDPKQKRMTIIESVASKKMSPGGTASFKLSAGTASLDLTGDAVANESDGTVNIEVNGPPNPRVFALLKAGPSLVIERSLLRERLHHVSAEAADRTFLDGHQHLVLAREPQHEIRIEGLGEARIRDGGRKSQMTELVGSLQAFGEPRAEREQRDLV